MSTTQEERTLSGLVHLGVLFGWLGLAFQLVMLFVYLPKSRYVAGHAKQALGLWASLFLVRIVIGALTGGIGIAMAFNPFRFMGGAALGTFFLGAAFLGLVGLGVLVMVIIAMIKAFNGETYRYPVIGDLVASIAGE